MQEVDRVVARVRGRENEQHDALGPVLAFVNANMQVGLCAACNTPHRSAFLAADHTATSNALWHCMLCCSVLLLGEAIQTTHLVCLCESV